MTETKAPPFVSGLVKVTDTYMSMIEHQLTGNGINLGGYARQCLMNAISGINNALQKSNVSWGDPQLDQSNLTEILTSVASLQLNAAASPREVFFSVRNVSFKKGKDGQGNDIVEWKKQIEMGIEGDGNDSILRRFGAAIKKVGQYWLVREGDEFEYPVFTGFDVIPPKWTPKGKGDVVRVVYPLLKDDDTVEFHIAERIDVVRNLIAHMSQNMMRETFGIVQGKKQDANWEQKKKIDAKKAEVMRQVKELGLEATLDHADFQKWISPAWTEPHSREGMIIRKMRNNATKKIPKDFGNAFVEMVHNEVIDAEYTEVRREIQENANTQPIDVRPEPEQPAVVEQEQDEADQPVEMPPTEPEPVTEADSVAQAVMEFDKTAEVTTATPAPTSRRGF
jgi:hypothetical protein